MKNKKKIVPIKTSFWKIYCWNLYFFFSIMIESIQFKLCVLIKWPFVRLAYLMHRIYRSIEEKPEHEWLKPVAGAHLATVKVTSRIVFYTIAILFATFLVWGNFFTIDEYVRAQGKIEPEGEIKTLSHFEGGIVQDILVKDGDFVKENQILLKLKDVSSKATYAESLQNYYNYLAQVVRLKAQINQKPLVFPQEIEDFSPDIVRETKGRYEARMASYQNEIKILKDQLEEHQNEWEEMKEKIQNLRKLHDLSAERVSLFAQLMKKNLVARTQFIQANIESSNRKMELESAQITLEKLKSGVQESKDKLEQAALHYNNQDWADLKEYNQRFEEAKKLIAAGKDRVERGNVKSPVNGIVQQLYVHTIGAAVTAGKELISIVPTKDTLLVEALVMPQDIGFIHEGQTATVKISAFDYSIYGSLTGIVEHVSPDAVQDPKDPQRTYFRVHIRTAKNKIDYRGRSYKIIPGETAQVDITTAKRTVMHYLLKPLEKSLSDALSER